MKVRLRLLTLEGPQFCYTCNNRVRQLTQVLIIYHNMKEAFNYDCIYCITITCLLSRCLR